MKNNIWRRIIAMILVFLLTFTDPGMNILASNKTSLITNDNMSVSPEEVEDYNNALRLEDFYIDDASLGLTALNQEENKLENHVHNQAKNQESGRTAAEISTNTYKKNDGTVSDIDTEYYSENSIDLSAYYAESLHCFANINYDFSKVNFGAHDGTFYIIFPKIIENIKISDSFDTEAANVTYMIEEIYDLEATEEADLAESFMGYKLSVAANDTVSGIIPIEFDIVSEREDSIKLVIEDVYTASYDIKSYLRAEVIIGDEYDDNNDSFGKNDADNKISGDTEGIGSDNNISGNTTTINNETENNTTSESIFELSHYTQEVEIGRVDVIKYEAGEEVAEREFSINGKLAFFETIDGVDWSSVTRPQEFDQKVMLIAHYTDADGLEATKYYYVQENFSREPFYLKMDHDGKGGGSFSINNVPNYIEDENGVKRYVNKYEVTVDTLNSDVPCYSASAFTVDETTSNSVLGTLMLSLITQEVTLMPQVVGNGSDAIFEINATYTNKATAYTVKSSKLTIKYDQSSASAKVIHVPVGITYEFTQAVKSGYKLGDTYIVQTTYDDETVEVPAPVEQSKKAQGIIVSGENVTITTKNYPQNLNYDISVKWIDNNNPNRPTLSRSNFTLMYKTLEDEWQEVAGNEANLGITTVGFDATGANLGEYLFTGLPSLDANDNEITYKIVPVNIGDDYEIITDNDHDFIFTRVVNYSADIYWYDMANDVAAREGIELPLKMYRKVEDGMYEEVAIPEGAIDKNDSYRWTVTIDGLPRFNEDNEEYDYVLVQGTIDVSETDPSKNVINYLTIPNYKTSYHNGEGNYGNDSKLCHNGGTIYERIYEYTTFEATKEWKDDEAKETRPQTTVTLWRYSVPNNAEHNNIDYMYANEKAARVIYRKFTGFDEYENALYEDILLSYQLSNEDSEVVHFNNETISSLPDYFMLPKRDEKGNNYVYFVRETVDGYNYNISYSTPDFDDASTKLDNSTMGAGNNGLITNIKREKVDVNVTKLWQSPSNVKNIDGTKIQFSILAPVVSDGEPAESDYEELQVLSSDLYSYDVLSDEALDAATTLSGFTQSVVSLSKDFYVNAYNSEGKPYDMTRAIIKEVKIIDKNGNEIAVAGTSDFVTKLDSNGMNITGEFKLTDESNENYISASSYKDVSVINGTKTYSYDTTNTITGTRSYYLQKNWHSNLAGKYSDIEAVVFNVQRKSTKDGSSYTNYTIDVPWNVSEVAGSTVWKTTFDNLPKYDDEGYSYVYTANEAGFILKDGTTKTIAEMRTERKWTQDYSRTSDGTSVTNYEPFGSTRYITVSKEWDDNGDDDSRKNTTIRVYRKADLLDYLNNLTDATDETIISLDDIDIEKADYTLTARNNWYVEFSVPSIEKAMKKLETAPAYSDVDATNYVIFEYKVGGVTDVAKAASYSYADLLKAATATTVKYEINGSCYNKDRQYDITVAREANAYNHARYILTNTRTGKVKIVINKLWNDENNIGDTRPDKIDFELLQNNKPYKTITIEKTAENESSASWEATLDDIPLFNDSGILYTYTLSESTVLDDYVMNGDEVTISAIPLTNKPDELLYTYEFSNTLTGVKDHSAYIKWNDIATGGEDRPDLYITLKRYLKKEAVENPDSSVASLSSYQSLEENYEQTWTPKQTVNGVTYDWEVYVKDLPHYNENGEEYEYVFEARLNNNGETVNGTYVADVLSIDKETGGIYENTSRNDSYETINFVISGMMEVKGDKVWSGLTNYRPNSADLPSPTIKLYRSINVYKNDVVQAMYENSSMTGDLEFVNQTVMDTDKYSFALPDVTDLSIAEINEALSNGLIVKNGTNYRLPKYNSDGYKYNYYLVETIEDSTADQLYSKLSAGGTLNNSFKTDINRREIEVTKSWAGRENLSRIETEFPSVTYTLYRYLVDAVSGLETDVTKVAEHTISPAEFKQSYVSNPANDGAVSYKFTDLLVYSPSGKEYKYYVTEKAIAGYTIDYKDEEGITDPNPNRSDVISIPANALKPGEAPEVTEIATVNTYSDPANITISGSKYWKDYGNSSLICGIRPDSITVTLKREAQKEGGYSNKVERDTVILGTTDEEIEAAKANNSPYIEWSVDEEDSDRWVYVIYNLEQFAPNGQPYTYYITEQAVTGYNQSQQTVSKKASTIPGNSIIMDGLVNSFNGTYYVKKSWMDGNNIYALRPKNVTIVLQRKKAGLADTEENWENIPWVSGYDNLPTATTGLVNGETVPIVSVELNAEDYEMPNTKHNSWEYTFTNLPTRYGTGEGETYEYRCIEIKIGGAELSLVEKTDKLTGVKKEVYQAGAYIRTYSKQNGEETYIQNTLDATELYVEKKWEGDSFDGIEDYYNQRPEEVKFVLQKREAEVDDGSSSTNDSNWVNVKKADGSDFIFTLSAANGWSTTLEDLPVATLSDDGSITYNIYFRALELHNNETAAESPTLGSENYKDATSYEIHSTEHKFDLVMLRNESTITNVLRTDDASKKITVTKIWRRNPGEEKTAKFELVYRIKPADAAADDGSGWKCFGGDTAVHSSENGCKIYETSAVQGTSGDGVSFTWDNLPMYDKAGNLLEYKVVEDEIAGYFTDIVSSKASEDALYDTDYVFTNIELQSFSVTKKWISTDYSAKNEGGSYTATFVLEQSIEGDVDSDGHDIWSAVNADDISYYTGESFNNTITLTSTAAMDDTQSYTWNNLPMYTASGKKITYRARETKINGNDVDNDTDGKYIVTYRYEGHDESGLSADLAYADNNEEAVNRMVYGFVNMSKMAAFINPEITADSYNSSDVKLQSVIFDIYKGTGDSKTLYIKGIKTDANGNLIINSDGTYGDNADGIIGTSDDPKYLVAGTYTLVESDDNLTSDNNADYSIWKDGITFTVGLTEGTTGEHGTAWIYTKTSYDTASKMSLEVTYLPSSAAEHYAFDDCTEATNSAGNENAFNLESRGVIKFTKLGSDGASLNTHAAATGESKTYFGVYTDIACTNQVAGMMAYEEVDISGTTGLKIELSTMSKDGVTDNSATFLNIRNSANIPYLREDADGRLTLLSGTYYIKELVAPAGYKLDTVVRKAVIAKIEKTELDTDLTDVYQDNEAKLGITSASVLADDYKWNNEPNVVTIYKKDQFGRDVTLATDGYLELKVSSTTEDTNAFPTGEDVIRLYQSTSEPAKMSDGSSIASGIDTGITYDADNSCWVITGLFDINNTYTLSEPAASVPGTNIIAEDIKFSMENDGEFTVTADSSNKNVATAVILTGHGEDDDYKNFYYSSSDNNLVVLRDSARYLKNISLEKLDNLDDSPIENISFKLYKKEGLVNKAVLADDVYLTTNEDGKIILSELSNDVINQITASPLNKGLDVGDYYFEEVERGASDAYIRSDNIELSITPNHQASYASYEDYAKVTYTETADGLIKQDENDDKNVIVKNNPTVTKPIILDITKKDNDDSTLIAGAKFNLTYTSINDGDAGAHISTVYYCVTNADGKLVYDISRYSGEYAANTEVDVSKKGTYELVEVLAAYGTDGKHSYMTKTAADGTPVLLLKFSVTEDNEVEADPVYYDSELTTAYTVDDSSADKVLISMDVKNKRTVVRLDKLTDIEASTKTSSSTSLGGESLEGATLEIYEGTVIDTSKRVYTVVTDGDISTVCFGDTVAVHTEGDNGLLKENVIYTLHENEAPVGYLEADDIYFKIYGTTIYDDGDGDSSNNETVSQIYVWTNKDVAPTLNGTYWSKLQNIKNNVLTMVDETIIAPVDVQKVVGKDGEYNILPGARFELVAKGDGIEGSVTKEDIILGTVKTDSKGYIVWESISDGVYDLGLIYDSSQKRIANNTVTGKSVILKQNLNGYTITEIYAPDNAFNEEKTFEVMITDDNYTAYRDSSYSSKLYVDIVKANNSADKTVNALSNRDNEAAAEAADLVNPPFEATFRLYKYDAEDPDINAAHNNYSAIGLKGVEFTIYKKLSGGSYQTTGTKVTTGDNGLLEIAIKEKGTYKLVETKALTGYNLNDKVMEFTIVNDDYKKTLTYTDDAETGLHTVILKDRDGSAVKKLDSEGNPTTEDENEYDLPNTRKHGSITLTKVDKDNTNIKLNNVKYKFTRVKLDNGVYVVDDINPLVDKYFPHIDTENAENSVTSLTLETGKTYDNIAAVNSASELSNNTSDTGTANPGVLKINDLQWGIYEFVEIEEVDGYILDGKKLYVEIGPNGLNQVAMDVGETDFVRNTKNQLSIVKKDITGNTVLTNAEFELINVTQTTAAGQLIEKEDNSVAVSYYTTKDAVTAVTGTFIANATEDGPKTIYGLKKGTYILREVKAPEGYELAKDVIFTIDNYGRISDVALSDTDPDTLVITREASQTEITKVAEYLTSGDGILRTNLITVKDEPIEVSLTKRLLDTELDSYIDISAARGNTSYKIYGKFAGSTAYETRTFTGNNILDDFKAIFVAGRDYVITETVAPYGYEVEKNSLTIRIGADGSIEDVSTGTQNFATLEAHNNGIGKIFFDDTPIRINLSKVYNNNGTVTPIDEDELGYAIFSVTGKFVSEDGLSITEETISNLSDNVLTGETLTVFEKTLAKRLIGGETYTVEETFAPNGFKIVKSFSMKVNTNGEITVKAVGNSTSTVPATETLVVQDEPIKINISKIDDNGALAGAKFTLTAEDKTSNVFVNLTNKPAGITASDDWSANKITWTTTTSPITFTNNLIADTSYRLHEDRIYYHEVMSEDIIFHITKDGKLVIDTNSGIPNNAGIVAASINTDNITMTVKNPIIKGKVILKKYYKEASTDADDYDADHLLEDAVYSLTRIKDAEGNAVNETVCATKTAKGKYLYAEGSSSSTVSSYVTDGNGQIEVTGLKEGTYEFVETDAPYAYHINNDKKIEFTIVDADDASKVIDPASSIDILDDEKHSYVMDTRINAKISLTKYKSDGTTTLSGVVFDVAYRETSPTSTDKAYTSIGTMTTGADGSVVFSKGIFPGSLSAEGLRRGYYKLTELKADGEMLNLSDGSRNEIYLTIGNTVDKTYVVSNVNDTEANYRVSGTGLIELTDTGVKNTEIPKKNIKVTKVWKDDSGLEITFRPASLMVQLYRSYNGGAKVAYGPPMTISAANDWSYEWINLPAYVNEKLDGEAVTEYSYLYTYTVEEVSKPTWYTKLEVNEHLQSALIETDIKDGNTNSTITNTLTGGSDKKKITIKKTLGGGSKNDTFYVRVVLKKNGVVVGNNSSGYYLDPYDVKKISDDSVVETGRNDNNDVNGWMSFRADEYITFSIPKGVSYEVIEKTTGDGDSDDSAYTTDSNTESGLKYYPRYTGNTGTIGNTDVSVEIRNAVHKSLSFTKLGENNDKLEGAKIEVIYTPLSQDDYPGVTLYTGNAYDETFTTDSDGKIVDADGNLLDLTNQGTYVIKEIKAPDGYITPTDNDGRAYVLATITVNEYDVMTAVKGSLNATDSALDDTTKSLISIQRNLTNNICNLTVTNEKTKVRFSKKIDKATGDYLANAKLSVYDSSNNMIDVTWTTGDIETGADANAVHLIGEGKLKEGEIYRLHEVADSAPIGYLEADDVYFVIDGTYLDSDNVRYSRILITDSSGKTSVNNSKVDTNQDGEAYGEPAAISSILTLVDKTIKVPVTLLKVLKSSNGYSNLGEVLFSVKDNDKTGTEADLGNAKTRADGYLVWAKTEKGHTAGESIILQQNASGYTFTEIYAPSNAYNDSRSFVINPTDQNFRDYLADDTLWLNVRNGEMESKQYGFTYSLDPSSDGTVINLPYVSTISLNKYDNDEEGAYAGVANTEFTLYYATKNGDNWTIGSVVKTANYPGKSANTTGVFKTDADGKLKIEIHNKGYYILKETKAATGYKLGADPVTFKFELIDDSTAADKANNRFGYNETNELYVTDTPVSAGDPPKGIPNERLMGNLTLVKKDNVTNEALDGVEFLLTRTDDIGTGNADFVLHDAVTVVTGKTYNAVYNEVNGAWEIVEDVAVGVPGTIKVNGLNWGTYKFEETKEMSGYMLDDSTDYVYVIKASDLNPKMTIIPGDKYQGASGNGTNNTITNTRNVVTLHKIGVLDDNPSKNLSGAVFEVHEGASSAGCAVCEGTASASFKEAALAKFYASNEDRISASPSKLVTTVTSGSDGTVNIYGLPTDINSNTPKSYHLVETVAPKGYKLAGPVDFTIDRFGVVRVNSEVKTEVLMKDEPIKVTVKKIGEEKIDALTGAVFELFDICPDGCDHTFADGSRVLVDGTSSVNVTTSDDGTVLIPVERLIGGHKYQLMEIRAPEGYECTAVVNFNVDTNGLVSLISGTDGILAGSTKTEGGYTNAEKGISTAEVDATKTIITVSNEKIRLFLTKVDYDDNTVKLDGVKFVIKPAAGSSFASTHTETERELITNADGEIDIPIGLLLHGNSYILTETDIGDNLSYRFAKEEKDRQITFKVMDDGYAIIHSDATNDMFKVDPEDNEKLIVSNQRIKLVISKYDQVTGEPIDGVKLKLTKLDETQSLWEPVYVNGVTSVDGEWTTTTTNGEARFGYNLTDNFTPGIYKLEEVNTPSNYNGFAEALIFKISQTGRVTEVTDKADLTSTDVSGLTLINSNSWSKDNFMIKNPIDGKADKAVTTLNVTNAKYTDLMITKIGSDGEKLANVSLKLDYIDDIKSETKTTNQDGVVIFKDLPSGRYRITELDTAKGYNLLSSTIDVTIDRNGKVYKADYGEDEVTLSLYEPDTYDGTVAANKGLEASDTLLMTIVNKKGQMLPKTGFDTPAFPRYVLLVVAMIEGIILYYYYNRGRKRRKKKEVNKR